MRTDNSQSFVTAPLVRPRVWRWLGLACFVLFAPNLYSAVPTIRLVAVYCNDYKGRYGDINEGVLADRSYVTHFIQDHVIELAWNVNLQITEVMGAKSTAAGILEGFRSAVRNIAADDIVYFHFSGHGGIAKDNPQAGQLLYGSDLRTINRNELLREVSGLNCRLKVLVTDCCSDFHKKPVAEGGEPVDPFNSLYYLLMCHEGVVDITAASPGQVAWSTSNGGYLSVNLGSDMQRFSKWEEVFREASGRVAQETLEEFQTKQQPMARSLGRWLPEKALAVKDLPQYILPDALSRPLGREELAGMTLLQLYLARNEIAARRGHRFSTEMLGKYFFTRPWYQPSDSKTHPELGGVEAANANLILEVEKSKGGPFISRAPASTSAGAATPDVISYSSREPLSRVLLESLTLRELSLARNEIFARHGFPFSAPMLRKHFESKSHYKRREGMTDPPFTPLEQQNIWLIEKIERIKGGAYKW